MKAKLLLLPFTCFAPLTTLVVSLSRAAGVITVDDLSETGTGSFVPNGYQGLSWNKLLSIRFKLRFTCASILCLCLLLAVATCSNAQLTFFGQDFGSYPIVSHTNSDAAQASFLSEISVLGTENYDSLSGSNPSLTFGSGGITASTLNCTINSTFPAILTLPNSLGSFGIFPQPLTLLFNRPVTAFGTYIFDAGTIGGTLSLLLDNSGYPAFNQIVPVGNPTFVTSNVLYFGFVDALNPFDKITFQNTVTGDGITLDNTTVGAAAVPEPSALTLLLGCAAPVVLLAIRGRRCSLKERIGSGLNIKHFD